MRIAIVTASVHNGNTKKVVDAVAAKLPVTVIDATQTTAADLSGYDLVGFASGVYYSKFHKSLLSFAQANLPAGKPVFYLYTYGSLRPGYTKAIDEIAAAKGCTSRGEYGCPGLNTFGPFKLIGGMCKGHPNADDLAGAVAFVEGLAK